MEYIRITEAAEKMGVTVRRLQQLCKAGAIPGAMKQGRFWVIPDNGAGHDEYTEKLPLPIGISSYIEAVTTYYYVDKTLLIRDFLDALPKVSLYTRPRRFGKTLNMDMLRVFFEISEEDTSVYFRDKAVWSCGEKYTVYQGKYPVICLSFKDVKEVNWKNTLRAMKNVIRSEYARHEELAESTRCNSVEKAYYRDVISGEPDEVELSNALAILSGMLKKHHQKEAVIIIDEYDTPIQQGYMNGFYSDAVRFIRNLFSGAFKDNPALAYGFLTGILRIAKESIFSGLNNLKVNTIMDERYSEYFGFTRQEVRDMLAYYGHVEKEEEIRRWYDGYRFGKTDIYNPWSVVNYVDENCTPSAYWVSTSGNEMIGDILSDIDADTSDKLMVLLQGGDVTTAVRTDVIYPEVRRDPFAIFSFLLMTGYLKVNDSVIGEDGETYCTVSIPNREIGYVYSHEIISRMSRVHGESTSGMIREAMIRKDPVRLSELLQSFLLETISVYDGAGENFYHGLMLGLCAILNNRYRVLSNREAGYGRFDIALIPTESNRPGFIFELKATKNSKESLESLADAALRQIEEKDYRRELSARGVAEIHCMGIAFRGKEIAVKAE